MCLPLIRRVWPGMLLACLALSFTPPSQANDLKDTLEEIGQFLEKHGDEMIGAYSLYEWYRMTKQAIDSMDELALSIDNAKDLPGFIDEFGGQVSSRDSEELQ